MPVDIFEYSDYRSFLRDYLNQLKRRRPQLSLRCIALKTGLDPSFFSKVIGGKRKLSFEQGMNLAKFLKLSKRQHEYLELLIRYDRAKSEPERQSCYKKILLKQHFRTAAVVPEQAAFYEKWYYTVIRELLHIIPDCNVEKLSGMLIPQVSSGEVKQAIELLVSLGLLKKTPDGKLCITDTFITAADNIPATSIHGFQLQMIGLAKESLKKDKDLREISTVTLSLSRDGFDKIREVMVETRKQLMEIARNDTQSQNGVYQINFQAFPVAIVERTSI